MGLAMLLIVGSLNKSSIVLQLDLRACNLLIYPRYRAYKGLEELGGQEKASALGCTLKNILTLKCLSFLK